MDLPFVLGALLTMAGLQASQPALCAGPAATAPEAFVACARAATEKYQDRARAIRDGYRPIGRDFPAMGEHWIRIGLVFDGRIDPARPEVLNYVSVNGRAILVGLGYAVPLLRGETPPDAPAGRDAWHDHFRTIEDETVLPHAHDGHPIDAPRMAMLHAWIWSPNPGGVFAAENWALSFVRAGLPAPADHSPEAAKALSLLTGGAGYFAAQVAATIPERQDINIVRAALDAARTRVEAIVRNRHGSGLSTADLSALAQIWAEVAALGL